MTHRKLAYIYLALSILPLYGNENNSIKIEYVIEHQELKHELRSNLLLAFIQKQTSFLAWQTALQIGIFCCSSAMLGLTGMLVNNLRKDLAKLR